jgi:hypothetical protein
LFENLFQTFKDKNKEYLDSGRIHFEKKFLCSKLAGVGTLQMQKHDQQ